MVIDEWRVLTCLHVVKASLAGGRLQVAFPKAGVARAMRRKVAAVRPAADGADVAVLELAEPVPPEVRPAPLSCPEPADLVDEQWWAFGFPAGVPLGSDAYGTVGAALAYGWVRLDTESRYVVTQGFSGTGLWSPRFGAVVGLVGQAQAGGERRGDALALTLHQIDRDIPDEKLSVLARWSVAAAGESALAAWGWSLDSDVEAVRHWRPRARGVAVDGEAGYRFRGRRAALTDVVAWLDRPVVDRRVLVVTGSPGVGKSAVLGRVVTTADGGIRSALPPGDDGVKATIGSVSCAVHVKGKTALDVAIEIARAAAVRIPIEVTELVPALRVRLSRRSGLRFNLVLDALDEATGPQQARRIVEDVVLPLAALGPDVDAQIVVGTRRRDDGGNLLAAFGPNVAVVDLDVESYFEVADLAAYALATLQLSGAERIGNPYADDRVAELVADRIASLAGRNFLVAGLVARRHGLYDTVAVDASTLDFSADVDAALDAYISRLPLVGRVPAKVVLTALAYAQAPGLTVPLWRAALAGLRAKVKPADLAAFVRTSGANFLVEASSDPHSPRFRLFHQALNDALLRSRQRRRRTGQDQRGIARQLMLTGRANGWPDADGYLLRALPDHAGPGGLLDDLLLDDDYLLYADLTRLVLAADTAVSELARARAGLLRLTPGAAGADPSERSAMFSVGAVLTSTVPVGTRHPAPYRAAWAEASAPAEWAVLQGHVGDVTALGTVDTDDGVLLVTGGADATVRLWNPDNGQQVQVLTGPPGEVKAVCPVFIDQVPMVAAIGGDGAVRLWDLDTGGLVRILRRAGDGNSLCTAELSDGRTLLAVPAGEVVNLWDVSTGELVSELARQGASVATLCPIEAKHGELLAAAYRDRTVVVWDPADSRQVQTLTAGGIVMRDMCAIRTADGRSLLACSFWFGDGVSVWDIDTGEKVHSLSTSTWDGDVLCAVDVRHGTSLLASANQNGRRIRVWDPDSGRLQYVLESPTAGVRQIRVLATAAGRSLMAVTGNHDDKVRLIAADFNVAPEATTTGRQSAITISIFDAAEGRRLLMVGGGNGEARLLDPDTGQLVRSLPVAALALRVSAVRNSNGHHQVVSVASDGTLRLLDADTGAEQHTLGRSQWMPILAEASTGDDRVLLITARRDDISRWDPLTGRQLHGRFDWRLRLYRWLRPWRRGVDWVVAMAAVPTGTGRRLLAYARSDGLVRLRDLNTGRPGAHLRGYRGVINVLHAVMGAGGQWLLVSGGNDAVVRLWDPDSGAEMHALRGHTAPIRALCTVGPDDGPQLLASAGDDSTVRLWDPLTGAHQLTVPVHYPVEACVSVNDVVVVGFGTGLLAIRLAGEETVAPLPEVP
ncbi:trypsin-like peptidase domain-containing protein [Micromonospora sp. NPDC049662]|uniref:trypsin-like peptidase domain-containing protein n=1 Tax=Micromonospora sp. NPDC049662 TaxID=3155397 RepID=UPI0034185AAE